MSDIQHPASAAGRPGLPSDVQVALSQYGRVQQALHRHAIVSVADGSGTITDVNDKLCQISGYAREELIGQNHRILKSGEHAPAFFQNLWETISQGRVWQGEICNRRKDGNLYWVETTITPFLDDGGLPEQYVSIRTDVTRIKAAEAAYRSQNAMREVMGEAAACLFAAHPETLDAAIERCLQRVGAHLAADRACLFQLSPDGKTLLNTHEWRAPGVAQQKQSLQRITREAVDWWLRQKQHGAWIHISDEVAMPPEVSASLDELQALGLRAVCVYPMRRDDRWAGFISFIRLHSISPPPDRDSPALSLLSLLADLIDSALIRRAAQSALEVTAARLNATLESTMDGILAADIHGQVLFCNQQLYRMWEVPEPIQHLLAAEGALLAHALTLVVNPAGFLRKVQALYQSGDTSDDLIEMIDGRIFESHTKPLLANTLKGARVWSFHDITQRVRAEAAAASAKERLRRGQLHANIGTWEWVVETGELFWAERIAPLFGLPQGELQTTYENFLAAVYPQDRQAVIDAVNACVERDVPYEIEHRVVWPDGTVRWLLERGGVERDDDGRPTKMFGVVQDIDDRKQAEIALLAAREEAERANRAKSEFLSSMSHELRTPLNAILGFGQLMELDATLAPEQRDNVQEIMKAGRHLLELINEVLDLAKVEDGRIRLSLEETDLQEVVQNCLTLMQPLAAARGIALQCADLSGWRLHTDRLRFKQVLLNLLSNAIKYNREQGVVTLEAHTSVPGMLRLTVRDTGLGIAPHHLLELFEPFRRLGAEAWAIQGTGIGLTITRRLVELMGGRVGVNSQLGVGSAFWVDLPLAMAQAALDALSPQAMRTAGPGEPAEPAVQPPTRTVLYIEDNPANIKLMGLIMRQRPEIKLITAQQASLGIELALACQPELVLLDIGLPKMDGYQVLAVLQQEPTLRHVPVLALSANALPRDIDRGMAAGFADYLTKPLDVGRFLVILDTLLGLAKEGA